MSYFIRKEQSWDHYPHRIPQVQRVHLLNHRHLEQACQHNASLQHGLDSIKQCALTLLDRSPISPEARIPAQS
ncbi:Protein P [Frankliniella fusca]|uniref:Protein P n=1 Tax=Frankliniella fusca TaxID=407009 RepID=A0AAE1LJ52_9NEOP|nr:Protein P [Frankliniella fusca]